MLAEGAAISPRELRAEEMHAIVAGHVERSLGESFETTRPLTWVRHGKGPFRAIFALQKAPLQGLIPRWGWSIDFVPHVGSKRVGWHGSAKRARIDVGNWNNITPLKYKGISYLRGSELFDEEFNSTNECETAVGDAFEFWREYTGIEGALRLTAEFRERGWLRPLVTHPLPEAFCLAKIGQRELAHERLIGESSELLRYHKPFDRTQILTELQLALDRVVSD